MPLTPDEIDEFLAEPHIAVVATASAAGVPHAMPIWYLWRDGKVLFHTGGDSKKMRNLRKNPRISVVVDSKVAPYKVVVIEGTASEEPGDAALARRSRSTTSVSGRAHGMRRGAESRGRWWW